MGIRSAFTHPFFNAAESLRPVPTGKGSGPRGRLGKKLASTTADPITPVPGCLCHAADLMVDGWSSPAAFFSAPLPCQSPGLPASCSISELHFLCRAQVTGKEDFHPGHPIPFVIPCTPFKCSTCLVRLATKCTPENLSAHRHVTSIEVPSPLFAVHFK